MKTPATQPIEQHPLGFFLGFGYARCLGLGAAGGIRGRSGRPGSFVSPWERGGLALEYAK